MAKRCGCGREYTSAEWDALPLLGYQQDEVETLALKNCAACKSTLAVEVPRSTLDTTGCSPERRSAPLPGLGRKFATFDEARSWAAEQIDASPETQPEAGQ